uniref:Uncharacterized protein n=1 Tax=Utricularia reniformis TaxID=192314 RepID=A0A1Y0B3I0_9LAMI|nr:hypothetical protein AEK19_MT1763 [Utricularia reniformis]ART31937.1 hypothetical protein AEK19_MT1763 [Utricularia reniformis]
MKVEEWCKNNHQKKLYAKGCSDESALSRPLDRSDIQMDQEKIWSVVDWEVPKKERAGSCGEAGCSKQFSIRAQEESKVATT